MRIEPMTDAHAAAVLAIYQAGIDTGLATFETAAPDWATFSAARLPAHRYVALADENADGNGDGDRNGDGILGWVACSPTSTRAAYAGVVEHSVYVHPDGQGRGVGRALLLALLGSTERAGIWTVQSGVFPQNTASLALHRRCGFREIGVRERVGRLAGEWRDVVLVERRSPLVN